jgi:hypothetical protein
MAEQKGYNGWTNYETWSVALIVDNDEGYQGMARDHAQDAWDDATAGGSFSREEQATFALADSLKGWITSPPEDGGLIPEMPEAPLADQLLNGALSEVNWHELAGHWLADIERQEWPGADELAAELDALKTDIPCPDDDSEEAYIDVRLQVRQGGGWTIHAGDSSYDLDHNGYWGASSLSRDTDCAELAEELIDQAKDMHAQSK